MKNIMKKLLRFLELLGPNQCFDYLMIELSFYLQVSIYNVEEKYSYCAPYEFSSLTAFR